MKLGFGLRIRIRIRVSIGVRIWITRGSQGIERIRLKARQS